MSAKIINLDDYQPTCSNCYWHDDTDKVCNCPGGWHWDKHFKRCVDFKRREAKPNEQASVPTRDASCDHG